LENATNGFANGFAAPPEEIRQKQAKLEALAALYQQRQRKALRGRTKLENKQIIKLGNIFRELDILWIEETVVIGILLEQMDKAKTKPDYTKHWQRLGEEYRARKEEETNGKANGAAADTGNAL
jgi:hypothetical protein